MYGFLGSPVKEEIPANTKLKAELTKGSRKASLGISTMLWLHMRGAETKPEPREEAGEQLLSKCQGEVGSRALPVKVTQWRGNFLAPLVFPARQQQLWKTAATSLSPALVFFASPLPTEFLLTVHKQEQCFPSPGLTEGQQNSAGRVPSDNSLSNQGRVFQSCLSSQDFRPSLQHRAGPAQSPGQEGCEVLWFVTDPTGLAKPFKTDL